MSFADTADTDSDIDSAGDETAAGSAETDEAPRASGSPNSYSWDSRSQDVRLHSEITVRKHVTHC